MAMPRNLVFVRHGESEGNIANRYSRRGDNRFFSPEFRKRHNSQLRLTDRGREQARIAGRWLHEHFKSPFHRYYVSEYIRTMETAAYLDLPGALWLPEFYLRERDWGMLNAVPEGEKDVLFERAMALRDVDPFYWTPPGGVSVADSCLRYDRVQDTLHRECAEKDVVIVSHGEFMWGARVRVERMPHSRYLELDASKNPHDHIHNCQIVWYTRVDPGTRELTPYLSWMRSVCPWDPSLSSNTWQRIARPRYTNEDLLRIVNEVPQIVEEEIG